MGLLDWFRGRSRSPLVRSIEAVARGGGRSALQSFYGQFLKSKLIVPVGADLSRPSEEDRETSAETRKIPFYTMEGPSGLTMLLAFTDQQSLNRWKTEPCSTIEVPGRKLAEIARDYPGSSLLLNCRGGSPGIEVTPSDVRAMLERTGVPALHGGGLKVDAVVNGVLVTEAQSPLPTGTEDAFKRFCAGRPEVDAAYLVEIQVGEGEEHLAIGLRFSNGIRDKQIQGFMGQLMEAVRPTLAKGEFVDFLVLNNRDAVSRRILETGTKIFSRKPS